MHFHLGNICLENNNISSFKSHPVIGGRYLLFLCSFWQDSGETKQSERQILTAEMDFYYCIWNTRILSFTASHLIVLRRDCILDKLTLCGNPALSESTGTIFPSAFIYSLPVSVSHLGDSHNTSNFFIIILCVIVILDVTVVIV